MALSPKILSIIQKAGTAVFHADAALQEAVVDSAKKVSDAMVRHPSDPQHDHLYQNWKAISSIAQSMRALEGELRNLYLLAASQAASDGPAIALPAPVSNPALEVLKAMDVTDVVVKRPSQKRKAARRASTVKGARRARSGAPDNTAKVLAQLQRVLNAQAFTKLNQSAVALAAGLPKGSIGASVKKLIREGKLLQGAAKEFKLVPTSTL